MAQGDSSEHLTVLDDPPVGAASVSAGFLRGGQPVNECLEAVRGTDIIGRPQAETVFVKAIAPLVMGVQPLRA